MGRRKLLSRLIYVLAVLALLAVAAEATVRLQGHRHWAPKASRLERLGGGSVFMQDSVLGYRNLPGAVQLRVNGEVEFTATHDAQGHRICGAGDPRGRKVWVLGCSFAHGYGVKDQEAFPALLQAQFPQWQFTNLGTDGYGPHQSLLQVRQMLAAGDTASLVILAYGGFHDQRVVCSPFWLKAISGQEAVAQWAYPCRRKGEWGLMPLHYSPVYPGVEYSAAMNLLDNRACARQDALLDATAETEAVIRELESLMGGAGGRLLVAGIWRHPDTDRMLARLSGIPTVDASPDPALTILPEDLHPNAAGHQQIASRLIPWLQRDSL